MKKKTYMAIIALVFLASASCKKEEDVLKNDLLKINFAPLIIGQKIQFDYAMGTLSGKLKTAWAEASIAGADGTGFEAYSWFNNIHGIDVPVKVADDLNTVNNVSTATFIVDTTAATLRYFYVIPDEARGRKLSFVFSSQTTLGDKTSRSSDEYKVSLMEMKRLINLTKDTCYFSIADMKAYTRDEVESGNLQSKIDFIYAYRDSLNGFAYGHCLVSPATEAKFRPADLIIPSACTNYTKMEKQYNKDGQLKGSDIPSIYLSDNDLKTVDLTEAPDFVLHFINDGGAFMETQDGTYVAYVYFNSANVLKGMATISIKRLELKPVL